MPSDYDRIRTENLREYGEGTRHLAFLGRLYADRTHFVFELLQNAEDAKATKIRFKLFHDRLEVWHNGRLFNEKDVRGVCGVGEGTGADDLTRIGKFGIGFKSVYAYTSRPEIHSGDEHFYIEHYVRPYAVDACPLGSDWTTLFVFPLNHPDISPEQAFQDIGKRLQELDVRTLLFLRHIAEIAWETENGAEGDYRRDTTNCGSARRVSLVGHGNGHEDRQTWLVFERPVPPPHDSAEVRVEVAFRVVEDEKTGKDRIERTKESPLVVFFPTEKPTHVGFLLQGPYRTTPARDNIPETDEWNRRLVQETAALLTEVLPQLREMGLLTVSLLEALPITPADFPTGGMFRPLFEQVLEALRTQPLLPTQDGGFVAATHAKLARGTELLDLLSPSQLQDLLGAKEPIRWLSGEITENRTQALYRCLVGYVRYSGDPEAIKPLVADLEVRPEHVVRKLTTTFMAKQEDSWVIRLYAFLGKQRDLWKMLREKEFVRLQDGRHVVPFRHDQAPNAYLSSAPEETAFPTVKHEIAADPEARAFLEGLGLREPDIVADVMENVLLRYRAGMEVEEVPADVHHSDIKKIARALNTDSQTKKVRLIEQLKKTPFVRAAKVCTRRKTFLPPDTVYIDDPKLTLFLDGNQQAWLLDDCYDSAAREALCQAGVSREIRVHYRKANAQGYVEISSGWGHHERGVGGFDPACDIDGLKYALQRPSGEKAAYIWNELLIPYRQQIRGVVESSGRQNFENGSREEVWSKMGKIVRDAAWLPDQNGTFHKPAALSLAELPDEFQRNEALASALGMQPTPLTALAQAAGVDAEDIKLIQNHPEEFARFKERVQNPARKGANEGEEIIPPHAPDVDFPTELAEAFSRPQIRKAADGLIPPTPVRNPERYRERTQEEIEQARQAEPPPAQRFWKVPRTVWEAKDRIVRSFLLEEYNGRCQICSETFSKRDGEPYFEGLYVVSYTRASWTDRPGNVLCLCAMCSAKFQHGVVEADNILKQVQAFRAQNEGGQAPLALGIRLCGEEVEIHFTERHMIDLQELLKTSVDRPPEDLRVGSVAEDRSEPRGPILPPAPPSES